MQGITENFKLTLFKVFFKSFYSFLFDFVFSVVGFRESTIQKNTLKSVGTLRVTRIINLKVNSL